MIGAIVRHQRMIKTETRGAIGIVRLARPNALNAFTLDMYAQLAAALETFDADDAISIIVVSAEGPDFCAGNDLSDFIDIDTLDPDVLSDPAQSKAARAVHALIDARKPIMGAVEGRAIGFGATMLFHFDYVVVAENAHLVLPFVDIGLVPEAGSSFLLPSKVGRGKAAELLFDPSPIPAAEAVELSLAAVVAEAGEAEALALKSAQRWAKRPVRSMMRTKDLLRGDTAQLRDLVTQEFHQLAASLNDPDTKARLMALRAG